jgi:hypothetical protein
MTVSVGLSMVFPSNPLRARLGTGRWDDRAEFAILKFRPIASGSIAMLKFQQKFLRRILSTSTGTQAAVGRKSV